MKITSLGHSTKLNKLTDKLPDAGAAKELARLGKENPGAGSISGKEMMDAILTGTKDKDGQTAGREYTTIQKWVGAHGKQLSPEAKKVFEVYEKACLKARAAGHTDIDFRTQAQLGRQMAAASRPGYQDASAGAALNELAAGNTKPGSISGKEMAEAIINGTRDLDGQGTSTEFADISKFVKENKQLLSPEALKVFDTYSKTVKSAQAHGQQGLPQEAFNRMTRDLLRVATPGYQDASAGAALNALAAGNTKPGSISGQEMMNAIVTGTADFDGQSSKAELKDITKFVRENEQLLSPEAKAVFAVYEKTAQAAAKTPEGGIGLRDFMKMQGEMKKVAEPRYTDASAAASLNALAAGNKEPGSISGRELSQAIMTGIADLDGNAAGSEFKDIAKFVKENEQLLSPEARQAFSVYERYASLAQARGQSGIPVADLARMGMEMQRVGGPVYGDQSAAQALTALAQGNTTPGSISGQEMMQAIVNGTADLDNQAAGAEFKDIAKFVRENQQLLSPQAKAVFAVYEQHAKAAQAQGQTGITLNDNWRMQLQMSAAAQPPPPLVALPATPLTALAQPTAPAGSVTTPQLVAGLLNTLQDLATNYGNPASLFPGTPAFGAVMNDIAQVLSAAQGLQSQLGAGAGPVLNALHQALGVIASLGQTPQGPVNLGEVFAPLQQQLQAHGTASAGPGTVAPGTADTGQNAPPPSLNPFQALPPWMRPPNIPFFPRPDASATAAITELKAGNTKPGSISGQEMAEAIIKGTADLDNQAAGTEFAAFAQFARDNQALLSPEAKKVFATYEGHARLAQARGQTGIPLGEYTQMQLQMRAIAGPVYQDVSAGEQLKALAAGNAQPGSISGKEMMDAIIQGTADLDGQAAGAEYADISKFVRENAQLLSPEAQKVFATYESHVKSAQAHGQQGIDLRDFMRMQGEMGQVSRPAYTDAGAAQVLTSLAQQNPKPGSISGAEMTEAIIAATRDLDNQAAGAEFKDVAKFVKENAQLLSPEAQRAFAVYERHAQAAQARGQTGLDLRDVARMNVEMRQVSQPAYQDRSTAAELTALAKGNTAPGSISGQEMMAAIIKGTADLDNNGAGKEFADVAKFVRENAQLLSPEAQRAFSVYEQHAKAAQAKGQTGIDLKDFSVMQVQMAVVSQPTFQDASAASAIRGLLANNKTPGSVSAGELTQAILRGTADLDNNGAGKEFADFAKFAKENAQLLSPQAKKAFAVYEKFAKAAQARGQTGIPQDQFAKMARELQMLSLFGK